MFGLYRRFRTPVFAACLRRVLCFSAFALLAALVPAIARAQNTINVPSDQPTIQAGINAAQNGDTVLVAPGTYNENIDFMGKAVTVMSSGGAATTIIDGGGNHPTVSFVTHETRASTISGFTIQNGGPFGNFNGLGGGIAMNVDNEQTGPDGYTGAAPSIIGNVITRNYCYGVNSYQSAPLIQNNEISFTLDPGDKCSIAGGAAIFVESRQASLSGSVRVPVILGNVIENNTNSGTEDAGDNGGAGIADWGADPVIQQNLIRNNTTESGTGGGINVASGGALVFNNLIYGNSAGCGGGGLAFAFGTDQGSGAGESFIVNNTIVGNDTNLLCGIPAAPGTQVYVWAQSSKTEFINNIIVGGSSKASIYCDPTYDGNPHQWTIFDHDDIFNAGGANFGGTCVEQSGSYGNLSADPLFTNPANSDYHLQTGSPAIDAGNNSGLQFLVNGGVDTTTDLDGNPREQDATSKGYPIVDMGAYEFSGAQEIGATTIVLTPSAYELDAGNNLVLTAMLFSPNGTPTGNLTFLEDGTQIGATTIDGTGTATLPVPSVVPGLHTFVANYPGLGGFTPAISVKVIVLADLYGTTLTFSSSPNPSLVGQSIALHVDISAVNGIPAGTITLTDNSTALAVLTPDASGNASFSTSALSLGSHFIAAAYPGDATHLGASANLTQAVVCGYPTQMSLSSSLNPASPGQTVAFTATVTSANGTPTGNVVFSDGSVALANQSLVNGSAVYSTAALATGSHTITATYQSSGGFAGSSASVTQVINGSPTTTTLSVAPNPIYALEPTTITVTVKAASGTPTGSIIFTDNGATIVSSPLTGGIANVTWTPATAGAHVLVATYSGDSTFNASTSAPLSQNVIINDSETSVTATPNPASAFQVVSLTAKVVSMSGSSFGTVPRGTVTFYDGTVSLGTVTLNANATATIGVGTFQVGTHSLTAAFAGNGAFQPSTSSPFTLVVNPDTTATALSVTPNPAAVGTVVTFSATVSALGVPSGTVSFYDGSVLLGTAALDATGNATFSNNTLAIGTHAITASYSGAANFIASVSGVVNETIFLYPGDFSISASPGPQSIYTGEAASYAVTLTPNGGWNQDVALTCEQVPAHIACILSPTAITGGSGTSTMTIQTSPPHQVATSEQRDSFPWRGLGGTTVLTSLALLILPRRLRRRTLFCAVLAIGALSALNGCGAPGPIAGGTPPGTYNITVTASFSQSGQTNIHSTAVTLVVKSLF